MDIDALRTVLQGADAIALGASLAAGFVFSFNPAVFATIPVVAAYVTKAGSPKRAAVLAGAFIAGMSLAHALLGAAAALGGEWAKSAMGRGWGLALGPLLIIIGLLWAGWLPLRLPWFSVRLRSAATVWGAFLLGIPFSVAVCPVCAPALLVALTTAAAVGSVPFGFALLLAYAAGRSVPILLASLGVGWLESLKVLGRYQKQLERVGGVTLVLAGLYFINSALFLLRY